MSGLLSLLVLAPPEKSRLGVREEIEVIKQVLGRIDSSLEGATSETVTESL
jgi:hypothetical protein